MYVTRPLSAYRNSPAAAACEVEPEGPNTGILVIEDEASESKWLFGLLKRRSVKALPFPQNMIMELRYTRNEGEHQRIDRLNALLIPVLNQPSSSNQYYVIRSRGRSKGLACTSSKEEDMTSCGCFTFTHDTTPQLFDPTNAYQQFQLDKNMSCLGPCGFMSHSMAPDGVPPRFLRHKGWRAYTKPLKNFKPTQALGVDVALRGRLPELNLKPTVVGKWYCPFIFIREGEVGDQMRSSPYYEMTLEQHWEEVFGCYNEGGLVGNGVEVDVYVKRQGVFVGGVAAERVVVDGGVVWFGEREVGVSTAVVERVKWEEERGGFRWGGHEEVERVVRREAFEGLGVWRRFGCYALVERFVLKRMDGSVVLTWDFTHTHQIRIKWE
ncbi:hypothetical protein SDJN03_27918, partial [Cucurbita argyrosperma subsp. sororia]